MCLVIVATVLSAKGEKNCEKTDAQKRKSEENYAATLLAKETVNYVSLVDMMLW